MESASLFIFINESSCLSLFYHTNQVNRDSKDYSLRATKFRLISKEGKLGIHDLEKENMTTIGIVWGLSLTGF